MLSCRGVLVFEQVEFFPVSELEACENDESPDCRSNDADRPGGEMGEFEVVNGQADG